VTVQAEQQGEEASLQLAAVLEETQRLEDEATGLQERRARGEASLARHREELGGKIQAARAGLQQGRELRRELQGLAEDLEEEEGEGKGKEDMQRQQLEVELGEVQQKLRADEELLRRLQEHAAELQARERRGGGIAMSCTALHCSRRHTALGLACIALYSILLRSANSCLSAVYWCDVCGKC
jgi:hypothetical protein